MNNKWINDSHENAEIFRHGRRFPGEKLQLIRMLDAIGMFETSWLVFNHIDNRFGYPLNE